MEESFSIEEAPLREALKERFGCIDIFSGADDLNRLLADLSGAGILKAPKDLEILIYPSAAEELDVALITVFSAANPNAHVVAISEELRKLTTRELWEGDDALARTVEIVESVVGIANEAVRAVRELEARGVGRPVVADARCPRCNAGDHLRVEYRYDLCGFARDGQMVLSRDGELTDIFCLACGEEVDDVLGPVGPVLAAAGRCDGGAR